MSASSTNTLGKYQIIREIARSNDIVYEAVDPTINRRLALKELCMPPNVNGAQKQERIERFRREGRAAANITHPNIVTIYEVGQENDRYFIAMEYLEGQTLRDMIQARGPLPIGDVVNYTLQLCAALSYAHQNGVIHRDIKPDNMHILPGGHVKLTDFGIARLMGESSITQDGQVFGTPSYMSPEQVAGKKLDTRSDIFSVGVMLYEMIAGKKPFAGDSVVTITYNIVNMEPSPPPGAPPYLVGIIRKAMAKDPDARYQSIDDLARDMREGKSSGPLPFDQGFTDAWQQNGQFPQPPLTPYGTSMPSPSAGAAPGSVPDPFAQGASVPTPMPPPMPPQPVLSAETRNFLGVFLLVVALTAMVAFAIWAVNLAFHSYETAMTSAPAAEHYELGEKAYARGDVETAMKEWSEAARTSPDSRVAKNARGRLFEAINVRARKSFDLRDAAGLEINGRAMVEAEPDRPEGYFYLGAAFDFQSDFANASRQYERAIQLGGNDSYAQAARQRLGRLYIHQGDRLAAEGQTQQAIAAYESAKLFGDSQIMQLAEQKIATLTYQQ